MICRKEKVQILSVIAELEDRLKKLGAERGEITKKLQGFHVWIFFSEPVPASLARQVGSSLITKTMILRYELDMKSYDRLFPNQDTLPKGGFGNLIALPLQNEAMSKGTTLFLDNNLVPYPDQ